MATVAYTHLKISDRGYCWAVQWAGMTGTDDGQWVLVPNFAILTFHVFGTFGPGSMGLQGTLEATPVAANAVTLNDWQGGAITGITANRLRRVAENCTYVRPLMAANPTTLTVILYGLADHMAQMAG